MTLRASVVITSRHRPEEMRRCLLALSQQDHPAFEVIVVADPATAATLPATVKTIIHDEANISAARNLGLMAAAGDVVAFIDDDAVAEPTWLGRLIAPLSDPGVAAAGGFVRGPDGIRWQARARVADRTGRTTDLPWQDDAPRVMAAPPEGAIRTEGTNMAFRRDALLAAGGFDPAYRYYLDDTDLNLRLAGAGAATAIVPGAQVHHQLAAGPHRDGGRAPVSLFEIGASMAVFLRRHGGDPVLPRWLREASRQRLIRHMVMGRLEPGQVRPLLCTLDAGFAEGCLRALPQILPLEAAPPAFRPYPAGAARGAILAGPPWRAAGCRAAARTARAGGQVATVLILWPGFLRPRMRFADTGIWEWQGGILPRSDRAESLLPRRRIAQVAARIARNRPIGKFPPDYT